MKETDAIVIFITTSTEEEARRLAALLLEQRKAACINIVPKVGSFFWWQGKVDSARESLLIIKTRASLLRQIIDLVKQVHSYKVPEIIAIPVIGGNEDYLEWINAVVRES